jgi:hypothetical protein
MQAVFLSAAVPGCKAGAAAGRRSQLRRSQTGRGGVTLSATPSIAGGVNRWEDCMPTSKNSGGSVEEQGNADNCAAVETAESTQTVGAQGNWVLVLKGAPRIANYTNGMNLVYNAKGTHNPGANNYLVVTSVVGPAKYKCTGPYPINI